VWTGIQKACQFVQPGSFGEGADFYFKMKPNTHSAARVLEVVHITAVVDHACCSNAHLGFLVAFQFIRSCHPQRAPFFYVTKGVPVLM
jgi:hypothetical protein